MTAAEPRANPPWTYADLALVAVSAVVPPLALAAPLALLSQAVAPGLFTGNKTVVTLTLQAFVYVFLMAALFMVVAWKYKQPFWLAIGWTLRFRGAFGYIAAGPVLAITVSILGVLLRAPEVDNPIQRMITGRGSLALVVMFGAVLAPFFEEITFRGFVLPLLTRTFGSTLGVFLTTLPFALLHGTQNQWAWQQIVLIALAGVAFGFARVSSGSTAAAFLLHASYNATQFLALILFTNF